MMGMDFLIQSLGLNPDELKKDIATARDAVVNGARDLQAIKRDVALILQQQAAIMSALGVAMPANTPEASNGERHDQAESQGGQGPAGVGGLSQPHDPHSAG